ncbi:hypothetical protein ACFL1S_03835 [Pseudomonadota bacterium]
MNHHKPARAFQISRKLLANGKGSQACGVRIVDRTVHIGASLFGALIS